MDTKEITVPASLEELDRVTDFVNEQLEAEGCLPKTRLQIDIAVEEIFVNIAHYAYHPEVGGLRSAARWEAIRSR